MVAILHRLTRVIAGIPVPNTPLLNSSIALAREVLPDDGFNHVMRSWLNGQAIINHLPQANRSKIDQEAFGVAAVLHDLGWGGFDGGSASFVSPDKRFEVDGAFGALAFINDHTKGSWNQHRLQLIWDSIALHTTPDISRYKQPEVAIMAAGVWTELLGIEYGQQFFSDIVTVNQSEWDAIVEVFPNKGMKGYFRDVLTGLCRVKPDTTYENPVGEYGERFLPNYTREGHKVIDILETALPE
ncbi:hypothetical protein BDV96DRAFT_647469 [Lophiotrema nucula]|uniref:HD domain-containing protein n=1 Tax=Lophiotrema nucula TaxID=690887 RepID=A0A6A5Z504_9PLEO|nr:hypothetical protein BDV96DRAFT_647469 [Lophiotrema nucula]